jgi:uncharacterized membrane protein YeaQ/YmgE (transglycosylase-associated protein family)
LGSQPSQIIILVVSDFIVIGATAGLLAEKIKGDNYNGSICTIKAFGTVI